MKKLEVATRQPQFMSRFRQSDCTMLLVRKFGLSLRILCQNMFILKGPCLWWCLTSSRPDIFSTMMSKHPWLLLGGSTGPESQRMLASFWKCYRLDHPSHSVFEFDEDRLKRTIPITVHGDGGRTQKKQPLEIFSIQPVMGLNTQTSRKRCSCHCETSVEFGGGDAGDPSTHCLNSKHNTYMTHFLVFAYPSKSYKGFNDLLTQGCWKLHARTLAPCALRGCLGLMGSGGIRLLSGLNSIWNGWQNVGRWRALIRMLAMFGEIPCCHECDAGMPNVPFEDVNKNALWTQTRFNTIPWSVDPPWVNIPFDPAKPAKFLRRDAFHIFRMGIGRNYIASCVFLLCYMKCLLRLWGPSEQSFLLNLFGLFRVEQISIVVKCVQSVGFCSWGFSVIGERNAIDKCLERAFGNPEAVLSGQWLERAKHSWLHSPQYACLEKSFSLVGLQRCGYNRHSEVAPVFPRPVDVWR